MVFALVQKGPGFLSIAEVVVETNTVFFSQNFFGDFSLQDTDFLFEPFEQTHLWIVSLQDAFGRELFQQDFAQKTFIALGSLAERLDYQVISIGVDDERRK